MHRLLSHFPLQPQQLPVLWHYPQKREDFLAARRIVISFNHLP
jgi:hypothetical protein